MRKLLPILLLTPGLALSLGAAIQNGLIAGNCSFGVVPTTATFTKAGGDSGFAVTAGAGCLWTATNNASWIHVTSGSSGSGNGTVNFSADANTGAGRSGTMTIAGRTVTITQEAGDICGSACIADALIIQNPTFARPSAGLTVTCPGGNPVTYYRAYEFSVTGCANAAVTAATCGESPCGGTGTLAASLLFIYRKSDGSASVPGSPIFAPANPCINVIAGNNNGCGSLASVTTNLSAGNFVVVVTANGAEEIGTFSLSVVVPGCTVTHVGGGTATLSGNKTICAGSPANLSVAMSGGTAPYTVTLDNGGGTQTGAGPTFNFTVSPGATTIYSIASAFDSSGGGCTLRSGTATVTVNASPEIPTIGLSPTNALSNSVGNQASGPAGATAYSWTITNGTMTTATNIQTVAYTAGLSNKVGLTLRVSNAFGCTASAQTNVAIIGNPPGITCPSNLRVNTPQNSASVPFSVTATGIPAPAVTCRIGTSVITSPYSFPPGLTTVDCTASNGVVPGATCSFTVAVNRIPSAQDDFFTTPTNTPLAIPYTTLKANDLDADGQALSVTNGSSASAEGGAVSFGGSTVAYTPPPFFFGDDTFNYIVSDTLGASSTGLVHVAVTRPDGLRMSLAFRTNVYRLSLAGVPGNKYDFESVTDVTGPWTRLARVTANSAGFAQLDTPVLPQPDMQFYRARAGRVIPQGLFLWYQAEGDTLDSFASHHATPWTAIGYAGGPIGRAFDFQGELLLINAGEIAAPWTAALWVNRSNTVSVSSALLMDTNFALKLEQPGLPERQVGFSRLGVADYTFNYTAPKGTWTHLVFVGTGTNTLLYADGMAVGSNSASIPLPVGQLGRAGADQLYALVDDVQVFTRALPPNDVLSLFVNTSSNLAGRALFFNGINQWVEINNGPTVGVNFTEEAWINFPPNDRALHGFLGSQLSPANRAPGLWIFDNTCIYAGFGDGVNWYSFLTSPILGPNAWYHVAVTYDGSLYRVYVNGVDVYDRPLEGVPVANPVSLIGRADSFLPGAIDDVRIWNVTRSAAEIKLNMNRRLNGNEPGLLLNFHFDEGSGLMTSDSAPSAGASQGTLINAPTWVPSTAPLE